jgi:dihydroxyacetone kinase DhaKLM complex PTS-EIIA-like component DhaM
MEPVGIVAVSHSGPLAESVCDLVRQLAYLDPDGPRLVPAGGIAGAIGTDAIAIANAIRRADRGAGVVVCADLGSAVLATTTAIEELLEPELAARTRISGGPLVEGCFVAAVQAGAGNSLDQVVAAANGAAQMDKLGSGS